ncbi:MAG: hypothetical protein M3R04_01605 [bacterium]|nr:hypothetical protein [bacterium]
MFKRSYKLLALWRIATIATLACPLLATPASSASGYKGRITTSISLRSAYFKAADPYGRSGLDASAFTIPPVTGMLYVVGQRIRLDMSAPAGTLTRLVDERGTYFLNHEKKTAWRIETGSDLPLFNLEQLAAGWPLLNARLAGAEGLKSTRLGSKKIRGQRCDGIRFIGDIRTLINADELHVVPGVPALTDPKGKWTGTFWVSRSLGLPLRITSSFCGIELAWEVSALQSWDVPELMLQLPPGYRVLRSY